MNEGILERPDFSAATDLYQVVDRVHEMRLLPVDLPSVGVLAIATLLPFVPVVLMNMPFDVIVGARSCFAGALRCKTRCSLRRRSRFRARSPAVLHKRNRLLPRSGDAGPKFPALMPDQSWVY